MKTKIFCIAFCLMIFPALTGFSGIKANTRITKTAEGEILYSFEYLTRGDYKYGCKSYLYNSTGSTLRVYYRFENSKNVTIDSDGGITDIPPYTKVWIATATVIDERYEWYSGDITWRWEKK